MAAGFHARWQRTTNEREELSDHRRDGTVDGERFDALTRRLARKNTRRQLLRGTTVGLGAIGLRLLGHEEADAVICRQLDVLCGSNAHCCSGVCDARTNRCTCPPGQTNCRGTCTSTATDLANCGGCGNSCLTGGFDEPVCDNGVCKENLTCPAGTAQICADTVRPVCCGPHTTCSTVRGEDYCCSDVPNAANWCERCSNNQFACCSQNTDVNECVCCAAGQTCNNSGRVPICNG